MVEIGIKSLANNRVNLNWAIGEAIPEHPKGEIELVTGTVRVFLVSYLSLHNAPIEHGYLEVNLESSSWVLRSKSDLYCGLIAQENEQA